MLSLFLLFQKPYSTITRCWSLLLKLIQALSWSSSVSQTNAAGNTRLQFCWSAEFVRCQGRRKVVGHAFKNYVSVSYPQLAIQACATTPISIPQDIFLKWIFEHAVKPVHMKLHESKVKNDSPWWNCSHSLSKVICSRVGCFRWWNVLVYPRFNGAWRSNFHQQANESKQKEVLNHFSWKKL